MKYFQNFTVAISLNLVQFIGLRDSMAYHLSFSHRYRLRNDIYVDSNYKGTLHMYTGSVMFSCKNCTRIQNKFT